MREVPRAQLELLRARLGVSCPRFNCSLGFQQVQDSRLYDHRWTTFSGFGGFSAWIPLNWYRLKRITTVL